VLLIFDKNYSIEKKGKSYLFERKYHLKFKNKIKIYVMDIF